MDQRQIGDAGAGNNEIRDGFVLGNQLIGAARGFAIQTIERGQRGLRIEVDEQGADI